MFLSLSWFISRSFSQDAVVTRTRNWSKPCRLRGEPGRTRKSIKTLCGPSGRQFETESSRVQHTGYDVNKVERLKSSNER